LYICIGQQSKAFSNSNDFNQSKTKPQMNNLSGSNSSWGIKPQTNNPFGTVGSNNEKKSQQTPAWGNPNSFQSAFSQKQKETNQTPAWGNPNSFQTAFCQKQKETNSFQSSPQTTQNPFNVWGQKAKEQTTQNPFNNSFAKSNVWGSTNNFQTAFSQAQKQNTSFPSSGFQQKAKEQTTQNPFLQNNPFTKEANLFQTAQQANLFQTSQQTSSVSAKQANPFQLPQPSKNQQTTFVCSFSEAPSNQSATPFQTSFTLGQAQPTQSSQPTPFLSDKPAQSQQQGNSTPWNWGNQHTQDANQNSQTKSATLWGEQPATAQPATAQPSPFAPTLTPCVDVKPTSTQATTFVWNSSSSVPPKPSQEPHCPQDQISTKDDPPFGVSSRGGQAQPQSTLISYNVNIPRSVARSTHSKDQTQATKPQTVLDFLQSSAPTPGTPPHNPLVSLSKEAVNRQNAHQRLARHLFEDRQQQEVELLWSRRQRRKNIRQLNLDPNMSLLQSDPEPTSDNCQPALLVQPSAEPAVQPAQPPQLRQPGYFTCPDMQILQQMSYEQLASVQNFTVGHRDFGQVTFEGRTNVNGLNLDDILVFEQGSLELYPTGTPQPPVGSELNKPASVVLYWCFPKASHNCCPDTAARKYEEQLRKIPGIQFRSYEKSKGEWKFDFCPS